MFMPATTRRRLLCGGCLLDNVCARAKATVPSPATIRRPEMRMVWQNHLVGLHMSYHALIDHHLDTLRDFFGRFENEGGQCIAAPGIASLLTPGAEFWLRDQIAGGPWRSVDDVPRLRVEAVGRWKIIATTMDIRDTIQPLCPRR